MPLLAAFLDLLSSAGFLLVWLRPDVTGVEWVERCAMTLLLEFFMIHAGGFYAEVLFSEGSRAIRSLILVMLVAVYLGLISIMAYEEHAWWMLKPFAWLSAGKLLAIWTMARSPTAQRLKTARIAWMVNAACYVVTIGLSVQVLRFPPLGVTADVIAAAGFRGSGLFAEQPQIALGAGALYFALLPLARACVGYAVRRIGPPQKG
ncbi:MAG: hypothetical protein OSA97_00095 [Nevskia sp.]|nr:hypothetical protein [Nevskia sp.]